MQKLDQKWPYLVWFGVNLGLNNLKFDQEVISDRIDSIGSTQSDRSDRLDRIDRIERIDRIDVKMDSWPNFKLFRPKFCPNRTKNGWFLPFLENCTTPFRIDRIDLIGSIGSMQKWIPGQILSCLDQNFVQIGPKMVDFCHFCKIVQPLFRSIRSTRSDRSDQCKNGFLAKF